MWYINACRKVRPDVRRGVFVFGGKFPFRQPKAVPFYTLQLPPWIETMKTKKPSAERVWKQFEDLAPRLRLSTTDRVVYTHLFRHSRLEGNLQLRFSISCLARGPGLSPNSLRSALPPLLSPASLRLFSTP